MFDSLMNDSTSSNFSSGASLFEGRSSCVWRWHLSSKVNSFLSYLHLYYTRALYLVFGVLVVSGCQSESKMLSAPVTGYNHTFSVINNFSVNGAGGANIGAHQGGGTEVCCGMIPRHWSAGLKAIVEWEVDPAPSGAIKREQYGQLDTKDYERHAANYTHHKVVVDIPRYDVPGSLKVHFLPCNEVRVSATGITPGYPGYPYNYPMNMPKICPSR